MSTRKKSPEIRAQVLDFLKNRWPFSEIVKYFKSQNIITSKATISRISNQKTNNINKLNQHETRGRKSILNSHQFEQLKKMVENPNPPTQKEMGNRFNVSRQVISYQIYKKMNKKRVKKPKVHALTEAAIEKRYRRSWSLYNLLKKNNWKKYITSDEALFYLSNRNGQTRCQYISRGENRSKCELFSCENKKQGVMVWMGISASGVTRPKFVKSGAKINSIYYQNKILKPFLRNDIPRLYPDSCFVFHQDSAPSHTSKSTIKFLTDHKVNFIRPEQWMPNSPDVAPCDYFLWGYLKHKVNQHKLKSLASLKKFITIEAKKIPQEIINKALKSWPKRCRQIYYNKGRQIECHN